MYYYEYHARQDNTTQNVWCEPRDLKKQTAMIEKIMLMTFPIIENTIRQKRFWDGQQHRVHRKATKQSGAPTKGASTVFTYHQVFAKESYPQLAKQQISQYHAQSQQKPIEVIVGQMSKFHRILTQGETLSPVQIQMWNTAIVLSRKQMEKMRSQLYKGPSFKTKVQPFPVPGTSSGSFGTYLFNCLPLWGDTAARPPFFGMPALHPVREHFRYTKICSNMCFLIPFRTSG